ncbi:LLM class flavin-dependent oxidoreductase [Clostridium sp. JNZ J1-5]
MGIKEDIKSYIIKSGWTLTQVQEELNKINNTNFSVQNLSKKLNNETIRYDELLQIAEIIGYKIEWIKKD